MANRVTPMDMIHRVGILRAILHIILLETSPPKADVEGDVERWFQVKQRIAPSNLSSWSRLHWLLKRYPAFRNVFYFRIARGQRVPGKVLLKMAKFLYRPVSTLVFRGDHVGPGVYIHYGYCTLIGAVRIGRNFWANQGVTVGYAGTSGLPRIGDNVYISAGAKVLGDITVGDYVIIGANAVVVRDVPSNCTVVGVPARIIKREGKRVDEPLT